MLEGDGVIRLHITCGGSGHVCASARSTQGRLQEGRLALGVAEGPLAVRRGHSGTHTFSQRGAAERMGGRGGQGGHVGGSPVGAGTGPTGPRITALREATWGGD